MCFQNEARHILDTILAQDVRCDQVYPRRLVGDIGTPGMGPKVQCANASFQNIVAPTATAKTKLSLNILLYTHTPLQPRLAVLAAATACVTDLLVEAVLCQ